MKKSLVTWALTAVPALILSACNGTTASGPGGIVPPPNNSSAVSHNGRVHRNDNGTQDLHAGGADVPAYAYNLGNQPVGYYYNQQSPPGQGSLFYAAPTQGTIYYCLTSSTDGRHAFEGYSDSGYPPTGPCAALGQTATGFGGRQDPLDFVGSAVAMPSSEYPYYKEYREPSTGTSWGEPFEFPEIGAPIVFGYRPQDFNNNVKEIKLSTWTYCAIANGTIDDWNDPAITADNGTSVTGGNSQTITFYFRADSAASTYNFVNHLNTVCNVTWKAPYSKAPYQQTGRSAAWTFGVNSTWPGPGSSGDPNANFIGETGDPGILAAIQTTAYSTGYVVGGYVKANNKVGQAFVQSGFANKKPIWVSPTNHTALVAAFNKITAADITYGEGSDEQPLGTSAPWCVLYVDYKNYVNPRAKAYPIVALSYLLFYGNNNGTHLADKTALIKFLESPLAAKVVNKLEYTSLSKSIQTATLNALAGNGGSQPACLQ
ncbi:MAG TPA: substrate-binding domain-containing protein [Candidatus Cybelea sp.]|nr:substrate-binding domain-containing protein [Candidatus Cybelea sp.]